MTQTKLDEHGDHAPQAQPLQAFVIVHPELGIYVGSFLGQGLWTRLEPGGQRAAICFDSIDDATEYMRGWTDGIPPEISFAAVTPDDIGPNASYASIEACVAAGLEGWDPDAVSAPAPNWR